MDKNGSSDEKAHLFMDRNLQWSVNLDKWKEEFFYFEEQSS